MRRSVYCTASFSVCSLRRAKFPIIYPDLRLDYKVATHPGREPAELWQFYIQLVEIEAAFKNLKDDLACVPFFTNWSIELNTSLWPSWLTVCTSSCHSCLHITLRARLRPLAPGLTPRAVLDKFATIQMLDVHFPSSGGGKYTVRCRFGQRGQLLLISSPDGLSWSMAQSAWAAICSLATTSMTSYLQSGKAYGSHHAHL